MTPGSTNEQVEILVRAIEGGLLDDAFEFWDGLPLEDRKDPELIEYWKRVWERTDSLGVDRRVVEVVVRETRGLRRERYVPRRGSGGPSAA